MQEGPEVGGTGHRPGLAAPSRQRRGHGAPWGRRNRFLSAGPSGPPASSPRAEARRRAASAIVCRGWGAPGDLGSHPLPPRSGPTPGLPRQKVGTHRGQPGRGASQGAGGARGPREASSDLRHLQPGQAPRDRPRRGAPGTRHRPRWNPARPRRPRRHLSPEGAPTPPPTQRLVPPALPRGTNSRGGGPCVGAAPPNRRGAW